MRKSYLIIILCVAMLMIAGGAGAMPITFTDTTTFNTTGTFPEEDFNFQWGWGDVNYLEGSGDYVSWTHHYEFAPPAADVTGGSLTLWLRDDEDVRAEFAFGWAEDGTWGFGEVDTNAYTYDVTASYLEDGSFSVVLVSLLGDFYIDRSELEITYNPIEAAHAPEPATMMLLGTGLIGIALFGRKKLLKKSQSN